MKGIELPINALMIVIMALLVGLGVIAIQPSSWGSANSVMGLESTKNSACLRFAAVDCKGASNVKTEGFDSNKDGKLDGNDDLGDLCSNFYDGQSCVQVCGCRASHGFAVEESEVKSHEEARCLFWAFQYCSLETDCGDDEAGVGDCEYGICCSMGPPCFGPDC